MMRSPLARLFAVAGGVAVIWGCSEVLAPGVRRFNGPTGQVIDPRCCPNNAASGCGCPSTLTGGSQGTGDTAGVALYLQQSLVCPRGLGPSGGPPVLGTGSPWPDSLILYVAVDSGGEGNHVLGRTVTISVKAVDSAGASIDGPYGHLHFGANGTPKPTGSLSQPSVNTGQQGLVTLIYRPSIVSGPIIIRATSPGALTIVDTFAVGVPGLAPMGGRSTYNLIGSLPEHPNSHNTIPAVQSRLDTLADVFFARFAQPIEFNDISIPLGGKFDYGYLDWGAQPRRHAEHRVGRDIDTRIINLSQIQQDFIRSRWQRLGGTVFQEGTPPHFHLRYRGPE